MISHFVLSSMPKCKKKLMYVYDKQTYISSCGHFNMLSCFLQEGKCMTAIHACVQAIDSFKYHKLDHLSPSRKKGDER